MVPREIPELDNRIGTQKVRLDRASQICGKNRAAASAADWHCGVSQWLLACMG
jgi:hypothetical protein